MFCAVAFLCVGDDLYKIFAIQYVFSASLSYQMDVVARHVEMMELAHRKVWNTAVFVLGDSQENTAKMVRAHQKKKKVQRYRSAILIH